MIGHTHISSTGGRRIRGEAGSVGMPYEDDVAAFWALVEDEPSVAADAVDVERAAAEIRASGWPRAEEFVTENLLYALRRAMRRSRSSKPRA